MGRDFPHARTGPGAHPSSRTMGAMSFPGGKVWPGRAADHSPFSSAAVMEEYSYTSTHPLDHNRACNGNTSHIITLLVPPFSSQRYVFYVLPVCLHFVSQCYSSAAQWLYTQQGRKECTEGGLYHNRNLCGFL